MLDFIVELIADLFGEGVDAAIRSKRVPLWVRLLLLVLLGGGLTVLFVLFAVWLYPEAGLLGALICAAFAAATATLTGIRIFKALRA